MQPDSSLGTQLYSLVVLLLCYVLPALSLWKMAQRRAIGNAWMVWVPILNVFPMLKLAGKPAWWFILLLVPIVNLVIVVMVMMSMCEAFGTSKWLGLLILIPPVMLILLPYLAFGTKDAVPPAPATPVAPSAPPAAPVA